MFEWLLKKRVDLPAENQSLNIQKKLVTLIILDGLGIHPDPLGNAVLQAKTPFLDTIWTKAHSTLLHASGVHVGLPELEPGNSEVGHLNIGSGQIVYQSLPRINDAISNGRFAENPVLKSAFETVKRRGSKLHLMGILSTGGVHGHIDHLFALLDICKEFGVEPLVHVFTDGRDTHPTDGYFFLSKLQEKLTALGTGKIASIMGRFYAMDRDKRWERTQLAYDAMVGKGKRTATDVFKVVQDAYKNDENDQILLPTTIVDSDGKPVAPISDNDVVIFYNFREDRARQITKAFVIEDFINIKKDPPVKDLYFVTMTGYEDNLPTHVVFPPKKIEESLAKALANKGLKQLHISETEKYMHVTYFFNGGIESPHEGEDFFNVPSPKVFDYSQTPEMSAAVIRDEVVYRLDRFEQFGYSFIVINFANPDMLGHTGNLAATVKANEFVDECTRDIVIKTLENNGCAMILSDHGNCETMIERETGKVDTFHNPNPVPFIIVDDLAQCKAKPGEEMTKLGTGRDVPTSGLLADVAPTVLAVLGYPAPESMTGLNLLQVL